MSSIANRFRSLRSLGAFAVLLLMLAPALAAQDPVAAPASVALARCTYDRCALRLDRGFRGETVREGLEGPALSMGFTGRTLTGLVDRVPAARVEAERGQRQRTRGSAAATVGGIILGSLLASTLSPDADIGGNQWAGLIGGGVVTIYGGVQLTRSAQSFSRAIWLYNREIPR